MTQTRRTLLSMLAVLPFVPLASKFTAAQDLLEFNRKNLMLVEARALLLPGLYSFAQDVDSSIYNASIDVIADGLLVKFGKHGQAPLGFFLPSRTVKDGTYKAIFCPVLRHAKELVDLGWGEYFTKHGANLLPTWQ